jgi:hypothetical protein
MRDLGNTVNEATFQRSTLPPSTHPVYASAFCSPANTTRVRCDRAGRRGGATPFTLAAINARTLLIVSPRGLRPASNSGHHRPACRSSCRSSRYAPDKHRRRRRTPPQHLQLDLSSHWSCAYITSDSSDTSSALTSDIRHVKSDTTMVNHGAWKMQMTSAASSKRALKNLD